MNTHDIELPPLPGKLLCMDTADLPKAIQDYARAAIEPYAKCIAELESARMAYASEFPINEDGEPDVGRIHENIRKLKADHMRKGEPMAWVKQDIVENQFINMRPRRIWWECNEGIGMPIYDAPQPTEPTQHPSYDRDCCHGHNPEPECKCASYDAQPADPDYKQLFEQMCERCDALDAKLAEYSEREPVAWHSKLYGTVWMAIKPGSLVPGTQWFIDGRTDPVAEVISPDSLVWHIPTGDLPHGTVFYSTPQPTEPDRGEPVAWKWRRTPATKWECVGHWDSIEAKAAAEMESQGWEVVRLYDSPQPAEPMMVPSDLDILEIWQEFRDYQTDWICKFARALLARYSKGTP